MESNEYLQKNKDSWNARTAYHLQSDFYDVPSFIKGKNSLNSIELELLGDVRAQNILHLQCHFGQDTLSLARMGAEVTGVDFSETAIQAAVDLSDKTGLSAQFLCCDLYHLPDCLQTRFDTVFTSYGTIGWLPDMDAWAKVVAHFLKPGGKLVFVEFHPVVWMFDNDFTKIEYSYFNQEPIVETLSGTYADTQAPIKHETVSWNHDLAEVLGALLKNGLSITTFREYDYSPYPCFAKVIEKEPSKYYIRDMEHKIPMVYAVVAQKPH